MDNGTAAVSSADDCAERHPRGHTLSSTGSGRSTWSFVRLGPVQRHSAVIKSHGRVDPKIVRWTLLLLTRRTLPFLFVWRTRRPLTGETATSSRASYEFANCFGVCQRAGRGDSLTLDGLFQGIVDACRLTIEGIYDECRQTRTG